FHKPVLMSATKTFPFSSTTIPELGWAETRPANRVSNATKGKSRVKQGRHMMHLRLRRPNDQAQRTRPPGKPHESRGCAAPGRVCCSAVRRVNGAFAAAAARIPGGEAQVCLAARAIAQ